MRWFSKRKQPITPEMAGAIHEIEQHKQAKQEAVKEAIQANAQLRSVLDGEDHFTIQIFRATGGHVARTKRAH